MNCQQTLHHGQLVPNRLLRGSPQPPGPQAALRFDIYRKVPKDLTQPTYTGAIISVCCCLFILFLFLSELTGFITTEIVNELYVDDPDKDSGGKIDVSLNISLPNLHCELVGLDIQDEMGRHEVGHIDNSMKIPLNNGVGCRFEGQFSINKVPGNFHVSTHSATAQPQNPDMTHVIHKLSFGDTLQVHNVHGAFNALGGADRLTSNPLASHDYILKIVPTVYEDKSGKQRYSYQYTVANKEYVAYSHTGRIIPAIWFRYDLSPITVKYTERRQPLYRFITTVSGRAPPPRSRTLSSPQGGVLSLSTQECLDMSSEVHQRQWHFIKKIFSRGECHSFIPIP
ncbi:endoplasmic reticulum-Golgi intermediate compartment protein 1 isoform X2 [Ovis aries]|uniref:endoplasmic reticulum-Golgi intermediate compartment protein 1 isoform X2 n=1 Tax=Ovis aries TaxID=9940 RepID=UPI0029527D5A|nr:endoplasmic reticulum-Golgi intermediate compartment protein 1 isoform X2 [Ovis aries]